MTRFRDDVADRDRLRPTEAGAVVFVASRLGPEGRGAFQEWRYRRTGRVVEVAEVNVFAPGAVLEAGAEGFLDYERGVPVVVARRGAPLGRPAVAVARRPTRHGPARPPRRRGGGRPGVGSGRWLLLALLVLAVVVVAQLR